MHVEKNPLNRSFADEKKEHDMHGHNCSCKFANRTGGGSTIAKIKHNMQSQTHFKYFSEKESRNKKGIWGTFPNAF